MRKQKKKYSKPQRPFDKVRIEEENILKEKYGLKNKKEIWKADASIGKIRNQAKKLITANDKEKKNFIERLQKKGFKITSIADALALNKEDWLKRRLQTIVFLNKLSNTPKQARQFIAHKHILIGNQIVNIPSYQVSSIQESEIKLNLKLEIKNLKISKEKKIKEEIIDSNILQNKENKIKETKIEEKKK